MDAVRSKWKRNIFFRAWERCLSLGAGGSCRKSTRDVCRSLQKRRSWDCCTITDQKGEEEDGISRRRNKCKVAPDGCFSVYVGPGKQRFVIKAEYANHPLFRLLLEDAEMEYGYTSEGPLLLPCGVDLFCKVLSEMDSSDDIRPASRSPCNPSSNKGFGSYSLLTPSRMLKLNHY